MKQARLDHTDLPRLGRVLRDLRQAAGLSQAALAARAGLAERTVGAVESGRSNPALPTVLALAAALGTSLDRLVAAVAAARGQVAVTRAGAAAAALPGAALAGGLRTLAPGRVEPLPDGAAFLMILSGTVLATTAAGDRLRLEPGDSCHARPGALAAWGAAGPQGAQVLCVTDTREGIQA